MNKNQNLILRIFDNIRSLLLNGILLVLPIALTIYLFQFVFKFIKSILFPLKRIEPQFLKNIPHNEIILAVLLLLLFGFISRIFFLKRVIHFFEDLAFKLPLVKTVYLGIKQIVQALTDQDKMSFTRVVLAEFPNKDSYSIGFLTGNCPKAMAPNDSENYVNIFIPTTPNPTTGFFIIMPREKIIITDMTRQEAMSLIISGGIIKPDRF